MKIFTILAVFPALATALCPLNATYIDELQLCLHPDNQAAPMGYAEQYCQAFGGHLLSVPNAFMNALITGFQIREIVGNRVYLGLRRSGPNGAWMWTDGSYYNFNKWASGYPYYDHDCAYLSSSDYYWRSTYCSESIPFFCGFPFDVPTPSCSTSAPVTCPGNSYYVEILGSCIYSENNEATFALAEKMCKAYNGHLISIPDAQTDELITGISFADFNKDSFYIGATRPGASFIFQWTDGTPWSYANWDRGQPSYGNSVVLDRVNAAWRAVDETTNFPYMCKLPPIKSDCSSTTTEASQTSPVLFTSTSAVISSASTIFPSMEPDTTTISTATASDTTTEYQSTATEFPYTASPTPLNCLPVEDQGLYNCNEGWNYFWGTDSYYYLGFNLFSYDAEDYCVSLGAHLASIHSEDENEFITNLCCESRCDAVNNYGYSGYILTGGYYDCCENGDNGWIWTDGSDFVGLRPVCNGTAPLVQGGAELYISTANCGGGGGCDDRPGAWVTGWPRYYPYFVCKKRA